jgi:hypothetical protein
MMRPSLAAAICLAVAAILIQRGTGEPLVAARIF